MATAKILSLQINDFRYELPDELIAQQPAAGRTDSRLMVLNRAEQSIVHARFRDLADWLPAGSLIVVNDARVVPVRLFGRRNTGGRVEAVILEPPPPDSRPGLYWLECLVKPARRLKHGEILGFGPELSAEFVRPGREGTRVLKFEFKDQPLKVLESLGRMPLPPYIRRDPEDDPEAGNDRARYQTVYALASGAVAAPTAGLHFTPEMLESLEARGYGRTALTLLVGYGTFAPLRELDMERGRLHPEKVIVPEETVRAVAETKAVGRPVTAVGTTVVRSLEWSAENGAVAPKCGLTDLFIRPGYEFKVVDHLITNFHLPGSSLLMLVAAFAGREFILEAYARAVAEKYRFYSYGDAMLIL